MIGARPAPPKTWTVEELAHCGDSLAAALGNVVAMAEAGELDEEKLEHARRGILMWHRISYQARHPGSTA